MVAFLEFSSIIFYSCNSLLLLLTRYRLRMCKASSRTKLIQAKFIKKVTILPKVFRLKEIK